MRGWRSEDGPGLNTGEGHHFRTSQEEGETQIPVFREPREGREQGCEVEGPREETCHVALSYDKRLLVFFAV